VNEDEPLPIDTLLPPEVAQHAVAQNPPARLVLNLGCGATNNQRLPPIFRAPSWREVRIDIDPRVRPHLIASVATLSYLADTSADAIWSSHNLEHLETHEVPGALADMLRVLKPGGFALITLPDLHAVAQLVVDGKLTATAYRSPLGPIRALDMLFGHSASLAAGRRYMAHRCGFDAESLGQALLTAGFHEVRIRKGTCYDLWAYALKSAREL